jgi:hypothetical protein
MMDRTYCARKSFDAYEEYYPGGGACALPTMTTPHAGQFDAFENEREFTHPQLDRRCVEGVVERSWQFEGPGFQPLVHNQQAVPDERQHFHAVASTIKKQKEMARLHPLPELLFDETAQPSETFAHVSGLGIGKDARRASEHQHGDGPPLPSADTACNTARIVAASQPVGICTRTTPGNSTTNVGLRPSSVRSGMIRTGTSGEAFFVRLRWGATAAPLPRDDCRRFRQA